LREQLDRPEQCETVEPELRDIEGGHLSACHFAEQVTPETVAKAADEQAKADAAALVSGESTEIDEDDDDSDGDQPTRRRLPRFPMGSSVLLRGGRRKKG
jgi:hypothetical protein